MREAGLCTVTASRSSGRGRAPRDDNVMNGIYKGEVGNPDCQVGLLQPLSQPC